MKKFLQKTTQNQQKPRIVQFVRCNTCGRSMAFHENSDTETVYKDTAGHIRKIERLGGQRIPVTGPNNAA